MYHSYPGTDLTCRVERASVIDVSGISTSIVEIDGAQHRFIYVYLEHGTTIMHYHTTMMKKYQQTASLIRDFRYHDTME